MRLAPAQEKVRRRLVGVVFLLVFALLVWLSVALYNKQFTPAATVTLYTDARRQRDAPWCRRQGPRRPGR